MRLISGWTAVVASYSLVLGPAAVYGNCCERTQVNMMEAPPHGKAKQSPPIPQGSLPDTFDWSDVAGTSYLVPNWNQHIPTYCGSCYAHAALSVVQDRIKVAKGGQAPDVMLARQSFLNCGEAHGFGKGCGGGNAPDIYNFMHEIGLPDETCNNYVARSSDTCDAEAMCMNCMVQDDGSHECWAIERQTRYYVKEWGMLSGGEEAMMSEIFTRGPIGCALLSDDAFDFGFDGGVHTLKADGNESDVNHDVEVTGWGVTREGLKFWQARNSWGSYWGEHGFFKIERGVNLTFIESECYFPVPEFRDEDLVSEGDLTGSMHGLVPKSERAAAEGTFFRERLGQLDWKTLEIPPALLAAGVLPGGGRVEEGGHDLGAGSPRLNRGQEGPSTSSGRSAATSGSSDEAWGWGLVVGAAGGVLASFCVVAIVQAIKRGIVRGSGGYDDISGSTRS